MTDPMTISTIADGQVAEIARKLTKAQHTACYNLTGEWGLAPHDGWRRAGQACSNLCLLGLAERALPGPAYRLTPLGLAVRGYLRSGK